MAISTLRLGTTWLKRLGPVLLALFLGGLIGRKTVRPNPPPVCEPRIVKETERLEVVKPEVRTVTQVGPSVTKRRVIVRVPDGTVTETTEQVNQGPVDIDTVARTERVRYVTETVQERVNTKVPDWSVSVQYGLSLVDPYLSLPGPDRGVLGVTVERRLLGPVTGGVWANTSGAAGLSVGVRW